MAAKGPERKMPTFPVYIKVVLKAKSYFVLGIHNEFTKQSGDGGYVGGRDRKERHPLP